MRGPYIASIARAAEVQLNSCAAVVIGESDSSCRAQSSSCNTTLRLIATQLEGNSNTLEGNYNAIGGYD